MLKVFNEKSINGNRNQYLELSWFTAKVAGDAVV